MSKPTTIVVPRIYAALGDPDADGRRPVYFDGKGDESKMRIIGYTVPNDPALSLLCEAYNAAMNATRRKG